VRRQRLVRVTHRVVFGTLEAVEQVLAVYGGQIYTAFVERINRTIRQHVAAVGRRVSTLCKGEEGLRQQLALYQVYYIVASRMRAYVSPCRSLCPPPVRVRPRCGSRIRQRWPPG
jgi:hypothetical protein